MAFTVETVEVLALAAADLTIAADVGLIFGDAGEKIEGDGTNLTVASSGLLTLTATGNTVVTNNALISGTSTFTGLTTHGGNVISDTDSTDDLGTTSVRWANVYTDNIGDTGQDLTVLATTVNLPSGHVFDYNSADVTLTHSSNTLTVAGGTFAAAALTTSGAATLASLVCTAGATFGGGYGSTGVSISTAGALSVDGATQISNTVTVGANDQGYDVILYGDTASSNITWDTSADDLIFNNAGIAVGSDQTGDVYYRDSSGFLERIAVGTNGQVLTSTGTIPNWEAIPSSGISFNGSTANGIVTYASSSVADVESVLTFDGTTFKLDYSNSGVTPEAGSDEIFLETDGDTGATFGSSTTGNGSLYFGDSVNAAMGGLDYDHNVDQLSIYSGGLPMIVAGNNGSIYLQDTANANVTVGLTINQGANDNEIFALKSSDVAHGMTDEAETDTWGAAEKFSSTNGGLEFNGYTEDEIGLQLQAYYTTDNTDKTTNANAPVRVNCRKKSGVGSGVQGANANSFVVLSGNNAKFLIDEDGDYFYDGVDGGAFDFNEALGGKVDDIALCRAYDLHASDPKTVISTRWDEYVGYNREDLNRAGILSRVSAEDASKGHRAMVSGRQLARLHNGAIWQTHIEIQQMKEDVAVALDEKDTRIALLEQRLNLLEN